MNKKGRKVKEATRHSPNFPCIFCEGIISQPNKPEHVLLNALGGRLTVRNVICGECNHRFGIGPDQDLADTAAFIRNICNLKAGDGDLPPSLNGFEANGYTFRLEPGMQPKVFSRKPLDVSFTDDEIRVQVDAYSDAQADKLLEGAARQIAKRLGHSKPEVVAAIKADLSKDKKSTFRPGPPIHKSLQFGEGRSQQAKAKACLVLWAHCVGNKELLSERYEAARNFANLGVAPKDRHELIKIDTRALPTTPEEFGQNPNIIWVGSDADGKVYGYFRLYGAIGWRILLCASGGPANRSHSLISNPLANQTWKVASDGESVLDSHWVFSEWNAYPPEFERVTERLNLLVEHSIKVSQEMMLANLFKEGLSKAGLKVGDVATEDQVATAASHVGRALTAFILRTDVLEE